MSDLKPHQHELLVTLVQRGAIPSDEIDGRNLRPLFSRNLAVEAFGMVRPTPEGRQVAAEPPSQHPRERSGPPLLPGRLSESQEELLRYLLRQDGPVPIDHLDGRSLRALESRDLITIRGGWAAPTPHGRTHFDAHLHQQARMRQRRVRSGKISARAEALMRVVDQLEHAIPRGAEMMVGNVPAYADDVLAGLRRFARDMDVG